MLNAIKSGLGTLFALLLNSLLALSFFLAEPVLKEPHGFLVQNEISDFSSPGFFLQLLFGSVLLCGLLGILMMNWSSRLSAGWMANLWATTFFLLWIDPGFFLFVQLPSFLFFKAFFLGLFFFILHSLDVEKRVSREVVPNEEKALDLMLFFWMLIDFIISILLISNSAG